MSRQFSGCPGAEVRPLAVTMGDPAGIGPEVIVRAVRELTLDGEEIPLIVVGHEATMKAAAAEVEGAPLPYAWQRGRPLVPLREGLAVFDVCGLTAKARFVPGHPSIEGAEAAYKCIVEATRMVMANEASALVTAPVSKQWISSAGRHFVGHSELLAELSGTSIWRMMFAGDLLRVALVTVHIGLAQVPAALSAEKVYDTIRLCADHLRVYFGIENPRIVVLGLNPHAGENGLFGDEEQRIISPAIERARSTGLDVLGPVAADSAFARPQGRFEFDAAVAMYHDQGLLPVKTLEFDRAVNVTLGLPFVRTSPDHGTAFDIAGKGKANSSSMKAAIKYAWSAVSKKRRSDSAARDLNSARFNARS